MAQVKRSSTMMSLMDSRRAPPRYVIAGGDWNLTQDPSDSSNGDHFASIPAQRKLLRSCLAHFNLKEVYQPLHTRFEGTNSSRLDRLYVSHTLADQSVLAPRVTFPSHPHQTGSKNAVTDHMPICLSWHDPKLSKNTKFCIPQCRIRAFPTQTPTW